MSNTDSILKIAKDTINMESKAIANLSNLLNEDFAYATQLIYNSEGRVIITGIGLEFVELVSIDVIATIGPVLSIVN